MAGYVRLLNLRGSPGELLLIFHAKRPFAYPVILSAVVELDMVKDNIRGPGEVSRWMGLISEKVKIALRDNRAGIECVIFLL